MNLVQNGLVLQKISRSQKPFLLFLLTGLPVEHILRQWTSQKPFMISEDSRKLCLMSSILRLEMLIWHWKLQVLYTVPLLNSIMIGGLIMVPGQL
ncbi:hypothetical protein D3C80_1646570 [compost metagenome]